MELSYMVVAVMELSYVVVEVMELSYMVVAVVDMTMVVGLYDAGEVVPLRRHLAGHRVLPLLRHLAGHRLLPLLFFPTFLTSTFLIGAESSSSS
jgi:hypothetical protein